MPTLYGANSGSGSAWAVAQDGSCFFRDGITANNPQGTSWTTIESNTNFAYITVSHTGQAWAIGQNGKVWYRQGITASNLKGTHWIKHPTAILNSISVGRNGMLWGTNSDGYVWICDGSLASATSDATWAVVGDNSLKLSLVRCGPNGQVWALDSAGKLYFRQGITASNLTGTNWSAPLKNTSPLKDISVGGNGQLVGITTDGALLFRTGITDTNPQGDGWQNYPAATGIQITCSPTGEVAHVNDNGQFWFRFGALPSSIGWSNYDAPKKLIAAELGGTPEAPANTLMIITSAAYGTLNTPEKNMDVTSILQNIQAKYGFIAVPGNMNSFFRKDPIPGTRKNLIINNAIVGDEGTDYSNATDVVPEKISTVLAELNISKATPFMAQTPTSAPAPASAGTALTYNTLVNIAITNAGASESTTPAPGKNIWIHADNRLGLAGVREPLVGSPAGDDRSVSGYNLVMLRKAGDYANKGQVNYGDQIEIVSLAAGPGTPALAGVIPNGLLWYINPNSRHDNRFFEILLAESTSTTAQTAIINKMQLFTLVNANNPAQTGSVRATDQVYITVASPNVAKDVSTGNARRVWCYGDSRHGNTYFELLVGDVEGLNRDVQAGKMLITPASRTAANGTLYDQIMKQPIITGTVAAPAPAPAPAPSPAPTPTPTPTPTPSVDPDVLGKSGAIVWRTSWQLAADNNGVITCSINPAFHTFVVLSPTPSITNKTICFCFSPAMFSNAGEALMTLGITGQKGGEDLSINSDEFRGWSHYLTNAVTKQQNDTLRINTGITDGRRFPIWVTIRNQIVRMGRGSVPESGALAEFDSKSALGETAFKYVSFFTWDEQPITDVKIAPLPQAPAQTPVGTAASSGIGAQDTIATNGRLVWKNSWKLPEKGLAQVNFRVGFNNKQEDPNNPQYYPKESDYSYAFIALSPEPKVTPESIMLCISTPPYWNTPTTKVQSITLAGPNIMVDTNTFAPRTAIDPRALLGGNRVPADFGMLDINATANSQQYVLTVDQQLDNAPYIRLSSGDKTPIYFNPMVATTAKKLRYISFATWDDKVVDQITIQPITRTSEITASPSAPWPQESDIVMNDTWQLQQDGSGQISLEVPLENSTTYIILRAAKQRSGNDTTIKIKPAFNKDINAWALSITVLATEQNDSFGGEVLAIYQAQVPTQPNVPLWIQTNNNRELFIGQSAIPGQNQLAVKAIPGLQKPRKLKSTPRYVGIGTEAAWNVDRYNPNIYSRARTCDINSLRVTP